MQSGSSQSMMPSRSLSTPSVHERPDSVVGGGGGGGGGTYNGAYDRSFKLGSCKPGGTTDRSYDAQSTGRSTFTDGSFRTEPPLTDRTDYSVGVQPSPGGEMAATAPLGSPRPAATSPRDKRDKFRERSIRSSARGAAAAAPAAPPTASEVDAKSPTKDFI